jgi:hypothetical protein
MENFENSNITPVQTPRFQFNGNGNNGNNGNVKIKQEI